MVSVTIENSSTEHSTALTIVHIQGELDSSSMEKIHGVCDEIVSKHAPFVIAEMAGVVLFSSSALGGFMGCRKRLVESGGDVVLAGLSLEIKSKLNLLGAGKIFRIYNDVRSAINAYDWEYKGKAETVNLSFPSELKFVPPVRQLVSRIAQQKGYSNRDSFRIESIVDEVCNNAVEHGLQGACRNVDITVKIDRQKIEIQVVNMSNPDKLKTLREMVKPDKNLAEAAATAGKRGRGLALIKMLSNKMEIDFSGNGTSVHITRFRGD